MYSRLLAEVGNREQGTGNREKWIRIYRAQYTKKPFARGIVMVSWEVITVNSCRKLDELSQM
jgi:hypothetical protein